MTPLERFAPAAPPVTRAPRTCTRRSCGPRPARSPRRPRVSLFSNSYEVDPALVGRKVELVFDPFDLTRIEVRFNDRPMGAAVPVVIGRHSHPAARPEPGTEEPPPATGIDYLHLVEARADAELPGASPTPASAPRAASSSLPSSGPASSPDGEDEEEEVTE